MSVLNKIVRLLFVATAVIAVAVLLPPREQPLAQEICIGDRCIRLDAFHRCGNAPEPCGCLYCVVGFEVCCDEKPR